MSTTRSAKAITVIPATIGRLSTVPSVNTKKQCVAAYARVSTDNEEQLSSYDAQVDYYTRYIQAKEEWQFIEVYTDEGISATNTKKRDGFKRMIADALAGKIDLILTKSVSRFARNTVDTLITVRQLKEKGVEVYFEKENIYTLDSKGELLITIMSSLAQEESRSISENVTWGQRKRFADGKVNMPYKQFLGYEKGENGLPKIVEKEAEVVRLIYKLFLDGKTPTGIATHLTSSSIPTPSGKVKWQSSTAESILTNEKYKGDAILQKRFTVDFLTKKMKVNEGEVPQYYVENSHPAIVSPEVFDLVQHEMKKRKEYGLHISGVNCLSGKMICGECGSFYGGKLWHSTSKYRRTVWQCNSKFKNAKKCATPHLYEDKIKQAFVDAFNSILANKKEIIKNYDEIIQSSMDTNALDEESLKIHGECDSLLEQIRKCVGENAQTLIDQVTYQQRYGGMAGRYEVNRERLAEIAKQKADFESRRKMIGEFLWMLRRREGLIIAFDEELWNAVVDVITVNSNESIVFSFRDGSAIPWTM